MDELNKCSCGGEAEIIHESWGRGAEGWSARCKKCRKSMAFVSAKESAVFIWNRMNAQKDGEING